MNIRFEVNSKSLVSIVLLIIIFIVFVKLNFIINIFALSFLISYILIPLVHYVEDRLHINRVLSVFFIFIIFFSLISLFFIIFLPFLYSEAVNFMKNIPDYINIIIGKLDYIAARFGYEIDLNLLKDFLLEKVNEYKVFIIKTSVSAAGTIIDYIFSIVGFLIIPILVFYFLKDFEVFLNKFLSIIKINTGLDVEYYNARFNDILKNYFRGQLLVCLLLAFLYGFINFLIGIKSGFVIGFLTGLLSFIPYLGFTVGITLSTILSYIQFSDIMHPLFVILGLGLVQIFESYFLTPKLIGESLGLHPITVIFALMAGGYLLGIGGMILSIPVAAFLKIILEEYLNSKSIENN
ncbi:MAG: AI-2E family transporter [Deferribacterales bacterium]